MDPNQVMEVGMSKQKSQSFDWNNTANDQMAMMASANGAFVKALAKVSQDYMEGVGTLTREFSEFLNVRFQHDAELGEVMTASKDWSQIAEAQQAWARQAGEEYLAEAQKIADLSMKMASNGTSHLAQQAVGTPEKVES